MFGDEGQTMIPTKQRKPRKDQKRFDLITISGVTLLVLAVVMMYAVDRPAGQTGGRTAAVKEAAAQASVCAGNARQPCDEAANARPGAQAGADEKAKVIKPAGLK